MKIIPTDPNKTIKAVARGSDPETSWEAAHELNQAEQKNQTLTQNRMYVLSLLKLVGPCTDEWLVFCYPQYFSEHPQSPSGIRTRRKELCREGLARWTGHKVSGRTGRNMRTWEAL